jgi:hypothetical protein
MTQSTAGDPFATPPGGRPAAPATPPGYAATPAPQPYPAQQQPYPPAPQAYPAPDGYYPYGGYAPQKKPKSWMNVVSLAAVGGGLIIPLLANIAGIVFGHLGRRAAKRGEADYRGVGLAGLILNYVAIVLWVLGIIAYIVFIVWALSECTNNPNSSFCSGSTTYGN